MLSPHEGDEAENHCPPTATAIRTGNRLKALLTAKPGMVGPQWTTRVDFDQSPIDTTTVELHGNTVLEFNNFQWQNPCPPKPLWSISPLSATQYWLERLPLINPPPV